VFREASVQVVFVPTGDGLPRPSQSEPNDPQQNGVVVREITGTERINPVGDRIGGTPLATTLNCCVDCCA
jgi:hypothetical protein